MVNKLDLEKREIGEHYWVKLYGVWVVALCKSHCDEKAYNWKTINRVDLFSCYDFDKIGALIPRPAPKPRNKSGRERA